MEQDEADLHKFVNKMISDMGAAMSGALVLVGDKLGLYKDLAATGPMDSTELAAHTGTSERYVREWLAAQAAAGFITYDASIERYSLSPEQAAAFADENSPFFMPGGFELIGSMFRDEPRITEAFRTGKGVGWHEHDPSLFRGTERFFRPGYAAHLVKEWIPALDGVLEKLMAHAPGGGFPLGRTRQSLKNLKGDNHDQDAGITIVLRAMEAPLRAIVSNAGDEPSVVVNRVLENKGSFGYNAASGEYGDMLAMGVVDPTKVTRTALQNASSIAGLMLTTACMVAELPEDKPAAPMGGDMGGMGGMGGMM